MKITKIEIAAIAITLVLLSLMMGFFLGRNTAVTTVVQASPEPSEALIPSAVPSVKVAPAGEPEETEDSVTESGLIDLNRATAQQLETLPGIGEVLAQRIIAYREAVGGFSSVAELKNVEGIGDKKFEALLNLIEVENVYENSGGR